jgi:hypothetical protein
VPPLEELPPDDEPPLDEPPLDEPPSETPPLEEPPLDEPPSGRPPSGGGLQGPQTPLVEPMATTHDEPAQQSALIVQPPHLGTQDPPA